MSVNPSVESPDLKEPLLTEAVEDVLPPAYDALDALDVSAAVTQSTTSPEFRQVSRVTSSSLQSCTPLHSQSRRFFFAYAGH